MNLFKIYLAFFIIHSLSSCSEFIEYPLDKVSIDLVAPMDKLSTKDSVINFWWNTHEDAKYYRFQLVSSDFDNIEKAIMDSLGVKNQIKLILKPGKYSWRVRPENNGNTGDYQSRYLEILPK